MKLTRGYTALAKNQVFPSQVAFVETKPSSHSCMQRCTSYIRGQNIMLVRAYFVD